MRQSILAILTERTRFGTITEVAVVRREIRPECLRVSIGHINARTPLDHIMRPNVVTNQIDKGSFNAIILTCCVGMENR